MNKNLVKTQLNKNKNPQLEIISTHIVSSWGKLSCYLNILSLFALASSWLRSTTQDSRKDYQNVAKNQGYI